MHDFGDIHDTVNSIAKLALLNCDHIQASTVGLDFRCGELFICKHYVATNTARSLDYYGGFEYISQEYRCTIGNYTFYSAEHQRVQDCIDSWSPEDNRDSEL